MEQLAYVGGGCRQRRVKVKGSVLLREGDGEGKEVISLHKWYPFVFPKEYDVRSMAFETRVQRLEAEHRAEVKAQKVRDAVEAFALELYDKRARQNTIELGASVNHKRVNVLV